jgi:hypothetical protein
MISVPSPGWSSRILIEVVVGRGTCWYSGEDHEKPGIEVLPAFSSRDAPYKSGNVSGNSEVGKFYI